MLSLAPRSLRDVPASGPGDPPARPPRTRGASAPLVAAAVALALALMLAAPAPADAAPPIAARVASLFVGQERVVEGKVVAAQREGNTVWLRFGSGPQDFVATLSIGLLSDFPTKPEEVYVGKTVRVAGTIKSFRGVPEIVVRDVSGIQIVEAGAPVSTTAPAPAAAPAAVVAAPVAAPPPTAAPSGNPEIEELREQVEALTRRVEALERGRAAHGKSGR